MDVKIKSSIAVDVATQIFIYPWYQWLPTLLKNQKTHDIVGVLGYMLTYHKATVWPLDELEIR